MSTATRFRRSATRLMRHFSDGATITLRRRHTLKSQRRGTPTVALVVNGAHLAGVSAISLRADLLEGILLAGGKFTIAGNATVYTVQADAEATAAALSASISPVLAANAADGAAVTLTLSYVDYTFVGMRGRQDVENIDTGEASTRRLVHLAGENAPVTPRLTDFIVLDSDPQIIAAIHPVNTGGGVIRWECALGGAA